jgi:Holliday junction resolvase
MEMKVLKSVKIDITKDHVNELCDYLNEHDFDGKEVLNLKVVTSHPKLFDFLFQPELCGWVLGNEFIEEIWNGDGWCEIYDVLNECGIEYDDE